MTKKPKRNPRSKPAAARSPIKIQPYGESNIGQQRQANEDSYLDLKEVAKQDPNLYAQIAERATQMGPLWIVADGMGGHVGGQQASRMVVREIMFHYYHDPAPDPGQRLVNAIHRANAAVYGYAQEHPELQGMGSTVVTAVLQNGSLHVAWVGDSRAYLLRQGHLTPLTEDHSWVQQALKQGTITREEAAAHPNRSVILRSIGAKPQVEPDLNHFQTQPGDIYLLCSDGLTGVVSDEEIKHALQSGAGPQAAVNRLIAQANERGGPDNITAAVIGLSAFKGAARPKSNRLPLVIAALLIALLAVVVIVMALGGGEKARETITKNLPQIQPAAQTSDTVIGVQTETPTTEPSPTQAPTPIPPTPTLIIATSPITTPTPTAAASPTITPTLLVSPTLLSPKQDESIFTGRPTTFRWRWPGSLPANTAFEIRIWLEGQDPEHYGATDVKETPVESLGNGEYEASFDVAAAESFRQHGNQTYHWTVAVVQVEPYAKLGQEAEPWPIHIAKPGLPGESEDEPGPAPGGGGGINF